MTLESAPPKAQRELPERSVILQAEEEVFFVPLSTLAELKKKAASGSRLLPLCLSCKGV
jgi:hypothetical protein